MKTRRSIRGCTADGTQPQLARPGASAKSVSMRKFAGSKPSTPHDDEGSILILAYIFLIVTALVVVTLSSWTANGLQNTTAFQNASGRLYAANGATQVAIRATRYTYTAPSPSLGQDCPGTLIQPINNVYVQDWCQTVTDVGVLVTREVTFTACLMGTSANPPAPTLGITGPACQTTAGTVPTLLTAVVDYYDYTTNSNPSSPNCSSVANESTCGANMQIVSWQSN